MCDLPPQKWVPRKQEDFSYRPRKWLKSLFHKAKTAPQWLKRPIQFDHHHTIKQSQKSRRKRKREDIQLLQLITIKETVTSLGQGKKVDLQASWAVLRNIHQIKRGCNQWEAAVKSLLRILTWPSLSTYHRDHLLRALSKLNHTQPKDSLLICHQAREYNLRVLLTFR